MMKGMKLGHKVFFYHSDVNNPGIAGICEVSYIFMRSVEFLSEI